MSIASIEYSLKDKDEESNIGIRFEETYPEKSNSEEDRGRSRTRRFSIHSRPRSLSGKILKGNDTVPAEVILPITFRTASHQVDNELKNDVKLESHNVQFANCTFHTDSIETIASKFTTSVVAGLSKFQYDSNLKQYGNNVQSKPPSQLLKKVFMYFFGGFGVLLLGGGVLCIICWKPLGDPPAVANLILGIVLLIVFLAQAIFNFFQDFSSSRVMDSIHDMIPTECTVIRDGNDVIVDSKTLVPGDLVRLATGAKVPADIRIMHCSPDLAFDRSILTGESNAIPASSIPNTKNSNYLESDCIAMQGTFCVNGTGKGIVVSTGDDTIFGTIAKLTSKPKKGLTPLQWEITRFVLITSSIIITLIVILVIIWAVWLRKQYPDWINVPTLIVDLVSVAVAFVPEGLPIALTTCLIITASQMKKSNILCKSLSVVETLGSVSVLCFDKTGTLTKNNMVVTNVCQGVNEIDLNNDKEEISAHVLTISSLCNEAAMCGEKAINGNATDKAVLEFATKILQPNMAAKNSVDNWGNKMEIPFNSKDKYMLSLLEPIAEIEDSWVDIGFNPECFESEEKYLLTVKGAPDIIIENCSAIMDCDTLSPLTEETKQEIKRIQTNWASNGKRVILLASKLVSKHGLNLQDRRQSSLLLKTEATENLIFVGLLGIEDPPRGNIDHVISRLREAGIKICMITGDYELTGVSIAKQVGIVTTEKVDKLNDLTFSSKSGSAISITGDDLNRMDEAQWENLIDYNELVFTRTTPEHKLLIIKQFQKYGAVIGMTGDGINDAPSLKQADVGISIMDASEIAKEASDLILMNNEDNDDQIFQSIIEALKYGRLVFENLKKTVGYLLPAGTYAELWPVLLNVIFGMPQMLSSFNMIIICCLTDCIGAIVLAYEPNERKLLSKQPRSVSKEKLADYRLFLHSYFTIGTFYAFTSMLLGFLNLKRHGVQFNQLSLSYGSYENIMIGNKSIEDYISMSSSIYFVNLVIMQLFNLLCMRCRHLSIFQHSPLLNKKLFIVMPIAFGITFIINYIPAIQTALGTAQVPVEYYFISLGFGIVVFVYDELRKLFVRRYPRSMLAKIAW